MSLLFESASSIASRKVSARCSLMSTPTRCNSGNGAGAVRKFGATCGTSRPRSSGAAAGTLSRPGGRTPGGG